MPTRTLEQRMEALHRANQVRIRRSQLKADIKAGRVQAIDIIAEPPAWCGTMRVRELLQAIPGVGAVKTRTWLDRAGVTVCAKLCALSVRQRAELALRIGRREPKLFMANAGRMSAEVLTAANTIRRERRLLHSEIAAMPHLEGWGRLAAVLEDPPSCVSSMLVMDLLLWADRVGPFHARRFMTASRVSSGRTVGMATVRQRGALAACLRGDVEGVRREAELREWAVRAAA